MRTIAIINQKGGCGKTTTAINLAGILARAGRRTLLVDMDPQSHCAAGLGIPEHRIDMDIGDAMLSVGERPIDSSRLLWKAGRNLDLAPSRMRLAGLEAARGGLSVLADKERRLALVLDEFRREYDLSLVDCSPAIGLLTFNALVAADLVIIPVETSFFSLQGATKQLNTVKTLSKRLGRTVPVWLLPTIHDEENSVAGDLLLELRRRFKDRLAPVVIRRDVRLKEAASFGQSIVDYDAQSSGAEDYTNLATWLLDQVSVLGPGPALAPGAGGDADPSLDPDPALIEVLPRDAGELVPRATSDEPRDKAGVSVGAATPVSIGATEIKSVSRAEDVARRAQQFLRRIATGSAASATATSAAIAGMGTSGTPAAMEPLSNFQPVRHEEAPHPTLRLLEQSRMEPGTLSTATQTLLGVRTTRQGVLFVQPLTAGARVSIAGDFNGWSPGASPMKRNETLGVFELCLRLQPGRYRYRLIVDGVWSADQFNESVEKNPFGELNSIVNVPPDA